jgi:hypothetical protein
MRNGIRLALLAAALALEAGCESGASSVGSQEHAGNPSRARPLAMRYQVDARRERVWWLTAQGVLVKRPGSAERTLVSIPGWTWAAVRSACWPDLALAPGGEAVITSNVLPIVWKIDPETLSVTEHPLALDADADKDVGFSGLMYSAEHGAYFAVSAAHGSLWKIDADLRRGEKIALSAPIHHACRVTGGRALPQAGGGAVGLCVGSTRRNWSIDVVAAERSAHVRGVPCMELVWQFRQLALNHP